MFENNYFHVFLPNIFLDESLFKGTHLFEQYLQCVQVLIYFEILNNVNQKAIRGNLKLISLELHENLQ